MFPQENLIDWRQRIFSPRNPGLGHEPTFHNTIWNTAAVPSATYRTKGFRRTRYPTSCPECNRREYKLLRLRQTMQRNNGPLWRFEEPWVSILPACWRFTFDLFTTKFSVHTRFDLPRVVVIGGQSSKRP